MTDTASAAVNADRAARATADSVTAPAAFQRALDIRTAQGWKLGGDKVPVLYTDTINGKQVCRDDIWLCTTAAFATPPAQAADSVTAPASGANWQDISTAPKDGTRFVAVGQNYGLDSEKQHTCIAQWLAGCWVEVSDWNGASKLKYLTHWMPLPPLPGSAARATADSVTAPAAGAVAHTISDAQIEAMPVWRNFVGLWPESRREIVDAVVDLLTTPPAKAADSVLEDAARWKMAVLVGNEVMMHPEKRTHPAAVKAYMDAVHSGLDLTGAIDAARKQGANHD